MGAVVVWVMTLLAALGLAWLRQNSIEGLIPYAVIAALPAIMTLGLWPVLHQEWARLTIIFGWLGLAIAACVGVAFFPMAILFLCAPAAALLFHKEMVIEAMTLSAILAAILYYFGQYDLLPDAVSSPGQGEWAKNTAMMACITMMVAVLIINGHRTGLSAETAEHKSDMHTPDTHTSAVVPPEAQLLTSLPQAVMHLGDNGQVLYMNAMARHVLKADAAGVDTHMPELSEILASDKATLMTIERLVAEVTAEQGSRTVIIELDAKDTKAEDTAYEGANIRHYETTLTPMPTGGVALSMMDVTHAHRDLMTAQKTAAMAHEASSDKTLFFAGVSHELRTPLNAIIGFSDMMRTRLFGPLPGKYAEYADLIHDSGQHMLDLIGDVLDLSKVEAGKYELQYSQFDMADVIRSSLKMTRPIADAGDVQLDTDIDENEDYILTADRRAVRQILLNLLSNAIKFSPKGSEVNISTQRVGETINVTVRDQGTGMSADELETLGTPFTQTASAHMTDQRGTGLGLSLVRSLVDLHKGRVSFASQPGEGTVVDIYLPMAPVAAPPSDI